MKLVFVSSTFKDMQFERDMLHTHVIPLLDDKLAKYGESSRFGDLRWGVNTSELSEEESSKKVLQVCLDQIDDCKPYMIVFIGERYGWIPSGDLIKNAAVLKGINTINDNISVTQLEIEYGALLNPDFEGRILFYFRELDKSGMSEEELKIYEAESPLHEEKIKELKQKIQTLYPDFVKTYKAKWNKETKKIDNLEPLMDVILDDLYHIFKIDIEKYNSLPWQERAVIASDNYFKEKAKIYINTTTVLTRLKAANESVSLWKYPDYLCSFNYYYGKEGKGKSTRVANKYVKSLEVDDDKINISIPFVFNIDTYTSNIHNLFSIIIYELEKAMGKKHRDIKCYTHEDYVSSFEDYAYLAKLLKKVKENNISIKVYVDDVKVNDFAPYFKELERLLINYEKETFYSNIPITFTFALNEDVIPPNIPFFDISETYPLGDLIDDEKRAIIINMLKFARKELSNRVINHLIDKNASDDPYYLSLVLNRLLMLDSHDFQAIRDMGDGIDAIDKYMISIIDNLGDDVLSISKELIKETAQRIDFDFVAKFLSITYFSNIWLSISEYEDIFRYLKYDYNALNASLLINNLKYFFSKRNSGTELKIEHSEVRKGLKEFIYENHYEYVLEDLFRYLKHLPKDNILKRYSLHFALSTNDGEFIAKYYLNNVKVVDNPTSKHLVEYKSYIDFIVKAIKEKKYDVLIDFFDTLCKEDVPLKHYYLVQALRKTKLNSDDELEFHNFIIDLHDRITPLNDLPFTDALKMWCQLYTSNTLEGLESINSFERVLTTYAYCNMSKSKLPRELVNDVAITLLRVTSKIAHQNNNFETLKIFFDEMIEEADKNLDGVVFKNYQRYLIKPYIIYLIMVICVRVDEKELYERYKKQFKSLLRKSIRDGHIYSMSDIASEAYVIGFYKNVGVYLDYDLEDDLNFALRHFYFDNVAPLIFDIDGCIDPIEFEDITKETNVEDLLYRAYKKTLFLKNYYKEYKSDVFHVVCLILEKLSRIETDELEQFGDSIVDVFEDILDDWAFNFRGGNDEYIGSAILNHFEYLAYFLDQLKLFNSTSIILDVLFKIEKMVEERLEHRVAPVDVVLYSLLYIYDDDDERISNYIRLFEDAYNKLDKNDPLVTYYVKLILACAKQISGQSEYDEYSETIEEIYMSKSDINEFIKY